MQRLADLHHHWPDSLWSAAALLHGRTRCKSICDSVQAGSRHKATSALISVMVAFAIVTVAVFNGGTRGKSSGTCRRESASADEKAI